MKNKKRQTIFEKIASKAIITVNEKLDQEEINPWNSPYLKAKLEKGQEILRKYPFPK